MKDLTLLAENTQTRILGVTILTSLSDENLADIGYQDAAQQSVERLASLTKRAGLSGVVCSAQEVETLRASQGSDFVLMVPGIRPAD